MLVWQCKVPGKYFVRIVLVGDSEPSVLRSSLALRCRAFCCFGVVSSWFCELFCSLTKFGLSIAVVSLLFWVNLVVNSLVSFVVRCCCFSVGGILGLVGVGSVMNSLR